MPSRARPSALAGATLALLADGVSHPDLVARFAANDASIDERTAQTVSMSWVT